MAYSKYMEDLQRTICSNMENNRLIPQQFVAADGTVILREDFGWYAK